MEIDKQTIKALSAETRIRILKILNENRRIAAELSNELGLAPSTVNEHLKTMEGAGLVRKNYTGHKWIYYEATDKGKSLIRPKMPISIILSLSLGIALVFFGGVNFYTASMYGTASVQSAMQKASEISGTVSGTIPSTAPTINWLYMVPIAIGIILVVFSLIKLKK